MVKAHDDFRLVVERYSRSVFRLAYRITGNEQDAEEVVQETFLRVYRRREGFQQRAQFSTWLHRIAVNCALDLIRARERHTANRVEAPAEEVETPDQLAAAASGEPAPDRLLLGAELGRHLHAALARLSPTERAAFVLRHHEGQGIEEIATALRLSVAATKNAVFRAVQKLRAALRNWI
jgi:RNA polymerase sigma-70 factor (ECF subfamily)